jgi:hypothetical protein
MTNLVQITGTDVGFNARALVEELAFDLMIVQFIGGVMIVVVAWYGAPLVWRIFKRMIGL